MIIRKLVFAFACLGAASAVFAQTKPGATDVGLPTSHATAKATYPPDRHPAVFPAAWPYQAGRAPVSGAHAMVAADGPLASLAGV